jgi:hypothetical protein
VSTPPSDNDKDLQAVEEILHTLAPVPVPSSLRRDFTHRLNQLSQRSDSMRLWLVAAAAAAVCIAAAPLAFRRTEPTGQSAEDTPGASAFEGFSLAEAPADLEETTEVLEIEDAGTTPMHGEAYRIVKVTLVHRTWDSALGVPPGRVLSERRSRSYLAVPLEIF